MQAYPSLSMLTLVLTALLCGDSWGQSDPRRGEALYASCVACHGADGGGNITNNTPRISGQHAWYLTRQLKNFKNGLRAYATNDTYGTQMRACAGTLKDDAAINDVVAYIQTLDSPESAPSLAGDPKKGKSLYRSCRSCHGGGADGKKSLLTPRINHQHDWYVYRQLMNFRRDYRGTHPRDNAGGRMWAAARAIPDDEAVADIVAYLKTLD